MMMMVFVDTTVWVAGIDASDELHQDGVSVLNAIAERRIPPAITTDFILDEALTLLKNRHVKVGLIIEAIGSILSSALVKVIYVDETLFKEALSAFRKYESLSFTDSVTLTAMIRYKVKEIYSHDDDFDLKGITRRERGPPVNF